MNLKDFLEITPWIIFKKLWRKMIVVNKILGIHYILDFYDCNKECLTSS